MQELSVYTSPLLWCMCIYTCSALYTPGRGAGKNALYWERVVIPVSHDGRERESLLWGVWKRLCWGRLYWSALREWSYIGIWWVFKWIFFLHISCTTTFSWLGFDSSFGRECEWKIKAVFQCGRKNNIRKFNGRKSMRRRIMRPDGCQFFCISV